jgi:DNA-binding helix-hairpin-helix protein with protein kinase domain
VLDPAESGEFYRESDRSVDPYMAVSRVTGATSAEGTQNIDEPIRPGQTLLMERAAAVVVVEDRFGEGSRGVVYRARLGDAPFAVKWIRPGPGTHELRNSVGALVQVGRPPHRAFVWPIDLVSSDIVPGFGYLMPLLEPRFTSRAPILDISVPPIRDVETNSSFRVRAIIGRELADAFAALHSSGLCYRDISFRNLRVDQDACEVAIIDNDNVGADGAPTLVSGTVSFMAPEILLNEAFPSTLADLYSLAVMLFYLLMHGHPLLGMRADATSTRERGGDMSETELMVRHFGVRPLFIFDPDDRSNGPVPGDPVAAWWPIYPQQIRRVFTQAFTNGLHDRSLAGRVTEGIWRRALLALHDSVSTCPGCHAPVYYDLEQAGQRCWQCGEVLPAPPRLKVPGGTLVLSEGAIVNGNHLYRDHNYRSACAAVELHPERPGDVVLRNLTVTTWTVVADGEEPKRVAPGQRLDVRPMQIDFGTVQGRILYPESER